MDFNSSWPNGTDLTGIGAAYGETNVDFFQFDHNGKTHTATLKGMSSIESIFKQASPLSSIVLRMAVMFAKGEFEVVNRNTENPVRGQYKGWDSLFLKPNPLQTRTKFLTQLLTYVLMRGYCYALPLYAEGFTDRPSSIWLLPPWCIRVEEIERKPFSYVEGEAMRKVFFTFDGVEEELDESELLLFTDAGAPFIDKRTWLPEPRISMLQLPTKNLIGGLLTRHSIIHNRGAEGILANTASDALGVQPIGETETKRLTNYYKSRYGRIGDQAPVIITEAALKYYPMGQKVKDMQLHEEHKSAMQDICDNLGYNYHLLSAADGAKFENAKQYKREVYDDTIIPLSNSLLEELNAGLRTTEQGILVRQTFDHLRVFQQNEEERGRGLVQMNTALEKMFLRSLITPNDWLKEIGREIIDPNKPDSYFNKYYNQMTPDERGAFIKQMAESEEETE